MKPLPLIDIDAKFILEVASGLREPAVIAEEYGYSAEQWLFLKTHPPFVKAVDAKKDELKANGYTFRLKAAVAAEDLLGDVYLAAKDEDASFHTKLESLKFLARAAGLDAPATKETESGPGFSITINLGNGQSVQIGGQPAMKTVEAVEEEYDFAESFGPYEPVAIPGDHHA